MEVSNELVMEIENKLKLSLKPKRFLHTLGVAYMSSSLAMCHGISHRDALIAGLLHDCAKNIPENKMLAECMKLNLPLSEHEMRIPELIHAAYGAYLAKSEYNIIQQDILLAIRNHTLGRPDMTGMEQIVYLADYLEPERTQPTNPSLDEIRAVAFKDLNKATYLVSKNTIHYFETAGKDIDPMTYEVYEYYKNIISKES